MSNFKHRNRGMITLGIVGLSAVAITATGFAAWVISGTGSKEVSGNIQVDTVENSNHTVAAELTGGDIVFGGNSTNSWIKNTDKTENLTASISVTVSNVTSAPANTEAILVTPTIKVTNAGGDDITSSVWNTIADGTATTAGVGGATANPDGTNGLVGALPTLSCSNGSYNSAAKTYTATIAIKFSWGQLFGGNNPSDYYAAKDIGVYAAEAQARLEALHTALDGAKYVVTVTSK